MKNEVIAKLEDQIVKKAVGMINLDQVAKRLAKKIEEEIESGLEGVLAERFDFQCWLEDELRDSTTPAGKAMDKAVSNMAKKMAEALK